MVEINNQRKAFLDMLAWSEGTDNGRQKTRNHGYDVIVGGELFTDYSDHPRKLVTLNPKLKSTAAGRYQLLSRWWDAYRKQLGLKDFSPKSQDAVALQQIKERGALPMIDRGDIRQAIDRCIIVCLSWAVNHYRDNAIAYKEQRDKAASIIADMQKRQRDVAELDARYTKELADANATIESLRADVSAGRKRLQVAATCAKSTTGASSMGDGESPRLTADAELNYYRLRSGIDRITAQVNYLQEYIRTQCLR